MSLHAKSDINITPLIDIVLVLLIIFIVMVPTLAKATSATLPYPGGDRKKGTPIPLVVTLDAIGHLRLQQDEVAWGELKDRLVPPLLLQPHGARRVFLKVAPDLPQSTVVRAMDEIRAASNLAQTRTAAPEGGGETKVVMSLAK
ncbi:MAG: biopolymer transporter ExbD [Firmicutes bacterium]|nr:biopolymer transporter ExbD [Bacillota bacterium]